MEGLMEKISFFAVTYGIRVLYAAAIFIIGKWLARIASNIVEKMMTKANVDLTLVTFLKNLIYMGLLTFVVIAAINKLGIQTASLIAVMGAAGLAVGLALQGSLSNFAAGVMIILFKPFKLGDFIDAAGTLGSVKEIRIFSTILAHPDNRKIIVPNSAITSGTITNFTDIDKRRVEVVFGISYDDDIKKAKDIIKKLVDADKRVLEDPACAIAVSELGDSSVNIVCRPWVEPANYWGVMTDLLEKGKIELEKAGLSIPYPQRDLHVHEEKKAK